MGQPERRELLSQAATFISQGTPADIGAVWYIGEGFAATRARILTGDPCHSSHFFISLLDALVGVHKAHGEVDSCMDNALLCVCSAVDAGIDDTTEGQLELAVSTLFSPPLGRPEALELFLDRGNQRPAR